MGNAMNNKNIS